jgi:hypothetical protein
MKKLYSVLTKSKKIPFVKVEVEEEEEWVKIDCRGDCASPTLGVKWEFS